MQNIGALLPIDVILLKCMDTILRLFYKWGQLLLFQDCLRCRRTRCKRGFLKLKFALQGVFSQLGVGPY